MPLVYFNWMTSVVIRQYKNPIISLVPTIWIPLIITFDDKNQGKEARKRKMAGSNIVH